MTTSTETPSAAQVSAALADQVEATSALLIGVSVGRGAHSGTALVLDAERRWLVTAAHLLHRSGARQVRLHLPDGGRASATVQGLDRALDVAVLAVDDAAVALPPAPDWSASDADLRLGGLVVTVGREPDGVRTTLGVVSALRGAWRTAGGADVARWIEVDAVLPGTSSGGLLLAAGGGAVGWNTHGLTRQGAVLPLAQVHAAALKAGEAGPDAVGGWGMLGVGVQPARTPDGGRGLLVNTVAADGPAALAGVLVGDVLTHLDGTPLRHPAELLRALAGRAGQPVTLSLLRGGVAQTLSATPAPRRPGHRGHRHGWGGGRCGPGWWRRSADSSEE